jgi:AcrR family transcriptional regulator
MVSPDPYRSQAPRRRRLPQEVIDRYKRERVARAAGLVVHEVGLPGVTVSLLIQRAAISRNTFYELFANREKAIIFASQLGNDRLKEAIEGGSGNEGDWRRRIEAAIERLIETVEAGPELAELCLVHAPGTEIAEAPFDPGLVQTLAEVLRPGRKESPGPGPDPRTEELVAFGILSVIAERLRRGEAKGLGGLAGELPVLVTGPFPGESTGEGLMDQAEFRS